MNFKTAYTLVFFTFYFFSYSQQNNKSQAQQTTKKGKSFDPDEEEQAAMDPYCLEISGHILQGKNVLTKIDVAVYCDGKVIDQYNTINEKTFKAGFKKNQIYSLVLKKQGFIPLVIIVNTDIPKQKKEKLNRFYFETEFKPTKNNLNPNYTDFPAAYVNFKPEQDAFNISDSYNTFIKGAIKLNK